MIRSIVDWLVVSEGSTRPAALLRIALALLAWSCWGPVLHAFDSREPWQLLVALNFWPSTTLMLIGLWTRFSTVWAAASVIALYHVGGFWLGSVPKDWIHHHHYLLMAGIALIAFTPCGRSFSVDRWRAEDPGPERGELWGMRLIAVQLSAVYFWGAYDKTNAVWFSGARLEHIFMWHYVGSDPLGPLTTGLLRIAAWLTVIGEYGLAFGLFVPRLRPVLIPLGLVLHALFYLLIPVGTFSLTCMVMYLAYLDPDAVHHAIDRVIGRRVDPRPTVG